MDVDAPSAPFIDIFLLAARSIRVCFWALEKKDFHPCPEPPVEGI